MFLFQLSKRNPCSTILPFFTAYRCFSAANSDPKPSELKSNFSAVDYLIASFGFSPDKAAKISKRITHLKSPEKTDAVLRFLNQQGFSQAEIQNLVTRYPTIFSSCPQTILEPNLNALRNMGLSSSAINNIILTSPAALLLQSAVARISFWWGFFGGDEADLVKAFKNNRGLLTHDIGTSIQPKISLLQRRGLSNHDIGRIVVRISRFITSRVSTIEDKLNCAKEIGFQSESGMFMHGFQAVTSNNTDLLKKKRELLTGFGWSHDEFLSAVQSAPRSVFLSEKKLQVKMDYLLRETRCDASYIATHPLLLSLSLEKRLRPRQHVLNQLESMGLSGKPQGQMESTGLSSKRQDYWNVMSLTDNKFVERYILPNEKIIPGLHEAYLAACGIQSTTSFKDVQV